MNLDNIQIIILSRDINGKRIQRDFPCRETCYQYLAKYFDENEEILIVKIGDVLIYNSLVNDPITLDDLIGFFA